MSYNIHKLSNELNTAGKITILTAVTGLLVFLVVFLFNVASTVNASQVASEFTTATRYDIAGRVTGTISPDPDGPGPLTYAATRITYNAIGLVSLIEQGELARWQSES